MSLYIYENWQAGPHKAIIHVGNCGFCNYGKGVAGGYDPRHAKWHPPYQQLPGRTGCGRQSAGRRCKTLPMRPW
ncbi:MAG: hypothetical protein WCD04_19770 [Terriglobia bacterium]|jgi:hypothetical protein